MGKSGKRPSVRSSTYEKELRNRIQDIYVNSLPHVDQLIDQLRARYPQYSRQKLQPFTRLVKQTLDSDDPTTNNKRNRKPPVFEYTDDDDDDVMQARKKTKKVDGRDRKESGSGEEEEEEEEEEVEESAVSMTGDDDRLKMEPEIDLMKSMLRNKYSKMDNAKRPGGENVVELEVVTNNNSNKNLDLMKERGGGVQVNGGKGKDWKSSKGGLSDDGPRFKDLGGMKEVLKKLKRRVIVPLLYPELKRILGARPTTGILLHGPPGCGKTKLAQAIANEAGVPFYKVSAAELVSGISGASEENIRELFSKAHRTAPSIVFIDEIDAIASKRENLQRGMEQRIVTQLLTCIDESYTSDGKTGYVLVIGATNRPDALDSALRRPERFDREISLGVPDENARVHILSVLTKNRKLEGDFDLVKLSRATPGFVGADLSALINEASDLAMDRIIDGRELELIKEGTDTEEYEDCWRNAWTAEEKEKLCITMSDSEAAAKLVQPSLKREGFSSIPDVKWEDVGGLDSLREQFERYIVRPIKDPDEYEEYGMDSETGFLLWGPPGCGKTLIAKAVANEAGANFIHIKGPELLNKYVGESELAVRTIFSRARRCSPCILFFDEVDALTTKRGREEGGVAEGVRKQLLIELDGGDQRKGVYVIGATNRPDVMGTALLRPGRFGKKIYVPLPNGDERALILKALCKNKPLDDDVDLVAIAHSEACAGLSGADLKALVNEATMASIEERGRKIKAAKAAAAAREGTSVSSSLSPNGWGSMPRTIKAVHFEQVSRIISPSVSKKEKRFYDRLKKRFK